MGTQDQSHVAVALFGMHEGGISVTVLALGLVVLPVHCTATQKCCWGGPSAAHTASFQRQTCVAPGISHSVPSECTWKGRDPRLRKLTWSNQRPTQSTSPATPRVYSIACTPPCVSISLSTCCSPPSPPLICWWMQKVQGHSKVPLPFLHSHLMRPSPSILFPTSSLTLGLPLLPPITSLVFPTLSYLLLFHTRSLSRLPSLVQLLLIFPYSAQLLHYYAFVL